MPDYTLSQCKEDMLKMWWWLHKNPTELKVNYMQLHNIPLNQWWNTCPACEYDLKQESDAFCIYCPITSWQSEGQCFCGAGSVYGRYRHAQRKQQYRSTSFYALEVYKLALQIKTEE